MFSGHSPGDILHTMTSNNNGKFYLMMQCHRNDRKYFLWYDCGVGIGHHQINQ